MEDFLLSDIEKKQKYRIRKVVKDVPHDLIRKIETEEVKFPREFIDIITKTNAVGLRFPKKYGGNESSWVGDMAAVEEMGYLGFTLSCMYSLGDIVGEPINRFGTEEQKKTYLKGITSGSKYGAEAITEPSGGSDLFDMMKTTAVKSGDNYILNGQKRFIVGGQGADFFFTYAKTRPDAKPVTHGISAFIVDRDTPGLKVETLYGLLGNRGGGTARIVFKDAKIPAENLVGSENEGYEVFNRMMVPERMTTAAGSIGVARAALGIATQYAMKRHAFGSKLIEHEGINFKIAEDVAQISASESLVYAASRSADELENGKLDLGYVRRLVSSAKLTSTEMMWKVVNDAMQIMGGIGYTTVYPVERLLRDARLGLIWTGSSEVMKLIIQHEFVKEITGPGYFDTLRNVDQDSVGMHMEAEKVFE